MNVIRTVLIAVGLAILAINLWQGSERSEREQQEALQKENQRQAEQKSAEFKAYESKRKEQAAAIANASNETLLGIFNDCRRRIADEISSTNKPAFAVYFPDYAATDLNRLATMATAMGSSTGRPSTLLNQDDALPKRLERLRQFPGSVFIVAESASDSFSGAKKWAAEYECELDGLSVTSVRRVGQRHFFN